MPLTMNGKVDRKALPEPDGSAFIHQVYEAPQGAAEATLASIWQDLLGVAQVGRQDNFFELGGQSLLAVQLIERLRQHDYTLVVRDLFSHPTLAALASVLVSQEKPVPADIPPNLIPAGCQQITPEMLTLVDLTPKILRRFQRPWSAAWLIFRTSTR
ncbi:phosphopantetheine-binding protein [Vibrio sp. PP-XX7]